MKFLPSRRHGHWRWRTPIAALATLLLGLTLVLPLAHAHDAPRAGDHCAVCSVAHAPALAAPHPDGAPRPVVLARAPGPGPDRRPAGAPLARPIGRAPPAA